MKNPYRGLPDYAFWSRAVPRNPEALVAPLTTPEFSINATDAVATAGSCFAQHIARHLDRNGFSYLCAERSTAGLADPHGYDLFSARYGNIYTCRQLLQTFDRAYGLFDPIDDVWRREDGRYIDAFRPRLVEDGFANPDAVRQHRVPHFAAIRKVFEKCRVFIFTLGLTEAWVSKLDGAVYPLAPGVVGEGRGDGDYAFVNFKASQVSGDLSAFIDKLRQVNPNAKIILTVSPVPLVATYSGKHVLSANTYSKSVLRVAAQEVADVYGDVMYFPSFEIITGPQARGSYYGEDLRTVTPEGVEAVMAVFSRHMMRETKDIGIASSDAQVDPALSDVQRGMTDTAVATAEKAVADEQAEASLIICDEEEIERSVLGNRE
ncbi:GSCFA domain-containing protein [Roseomonas sp. 18066]|uniref:GSCFA domain-containing protein n=1 Tax=Roseomonas sp. 18066 TaxID=2681412 RepID=UPI001357CA98|nr:GSCFA domain-containing protein [Roseomonas sp. 18066]